MEPSLDRNTFQKPLIIWLLILFLVIAPAIAWYLRPGSSNTTITKEHLYDVIEKYNAENPEVQVPSITIDSFKVTNDMWYLLNVRSTEDDQKGKMLIADFYNNPDSMQVLSTPFMMAFEKNISGIGVPYGVLEELNREIKQEQIDDEAQ